MNDENPAPILSVEEACASASRSLKVFTTSPNWPASTSTRGLNTSSQARCSTGCRNSRAHCVTSLSLFVVPCPSNA
jgi:hypothetical protein